MTAAWAWHRLRAPRRKVPLPDRLDWQRFVPREKIPEAMHATTSSVSQATKKTSAPP